VKQLSAKSIDTVRRGRWHSCFYWEYLADPVSVAIELDEDLKDRIATLKTKRDIA